MERKRSRRCAADHLTFCFALRAGECDYARLELRMVVPANAA